MPNADNKLVTIRFEHFGVKLYSPPSSCDDRPTITNLFRVFRYSEVVQRLI